jgi:hypothetical protein
LLALDSFKLRARERGKAETTRIYGQITRGALILRASPALRRGLAGDAPGAFGKAVPIGTIDAITWD